MKKCAFFLLLLAVAGMQLVYAQGLLVTGKVTNAADGQPIPGVSIVVRGTTIGTISDVDGTYKLTVPSNAVSLMFSFVGMKTVEVPIEGRTTIDVAMEEELTRLDEIVVVGYSTQRRTDITGAVSVVDADALVSQPAPNIGKQLQGRAAGVTVYTSGDPTAIGSIRIRGIGTINDNGPLIVIDGVSTRDQNLNNINPNDIESVQILKDASASSIYGAQASNGVIIITTKHGKTGRMQISYNGYYGTQKINKWWDLLDTEGWMNYWQRAQKTSIILRNWGEGLNTDKTFDQLYNDNNLWATDPNYMASHPQFGQIANVRLPDYIIPNGYIGNDPGEWSPTNRVTRLGNTNWFKEITQFAPITSHQISASGGTDNSNYNFGFNYFDQKGVVYTTFLRRYSFRANTELKVKNAIKLGENFTFAYTNQHSEGWQNEGWPVSMAYRLVPWVPVYDVRGEFAGSGADGAGNAQNPYAVLWRDGHNKDNNLRIFGNLFAEVNFLKHFLFKTSFGMSYGTGNGYSLRWPNPEHSEGSLATNFYEYMNWGYRWVYNNTLTFNYAIGTDHTITALVGTEAIQDGVGRGLDGQRQDYPFYQDLNTWTLGNGGTAGMSNNSYFYNKFALFGIFGRLDYAFRDKYLFTFNVRRDGASRFAARNRYGTFPAASIGWRISKEDFMQSVTFINDLKLRAGYGITGNSEIGAFNYAYTYGQSFWGWRSIAYDINGSNTGSMSGYALSQYGNPDTKWEENRMANVGLDAVLFNSALEVNLDLYTRKTSGMLVPDAYSPLAGFANAPYVNLGDMKNTGLDLSLTHRGKAGEFRYDVTGTISHYKNEVVKLNNIAATKFFGGGSRFGSTTVITKGQPMSTFYGYIIEGIYKSKEELANHAVQPGINNDAASLAGDKWRASLGKFKFKDINNDGVINADDKTFIGNPHPDFTYSLDVNFYWKNWELNIFLYGSQGNDIYNYVKYWTDFSGSFIGNRSKKILTDSWEFGKGDTPLPILDINNTTDANYSSTYYVEDGSFLRCKNLQLSYNLPKNLLQKVGVDNMKVYGQVTNLFTITKYSGPDPDVGALYLGGGGDWDRGLDFGFYPTPRTVMAGIILNF